jgi:hypothetical protein
MSAHLLIAGSRVLWVRSEREIVDVLHEGQLMLVFSVGREVEAMATAVEQLSREQQEDGVVRPARAGAGHGR